MTPGIYHDMDRKTYEALPYFNQSTLKKWIELGVKLNCPAAFKYWFDHRNDEDESEETVAQIEGTVIDTLVTEPEKYDLFYSVIPEGAPKKPTLKMRNAKKPAAKTLADIAFWDEFLEQSKGKRIIPYAMAQKCAAMADSLMARKDLQEVLKVCKKTVIIAEICGHMCKAELDLFCPSAVAKSRFVYDIKKVRNAANIDRKGFGDDAAKFGHYIQAPFYIDIAKAIGEHKDAFGFFMVEDQKRHGYQTNVLSLSTDDEVVQYGRRQYKHAIYSLSDAREKDHWPGYHAWEAVQFPFWIKSEAEEITV